MVKFIHGRTGNEMWVADDRVDEYKAAGHKPAADAVKPANKPKRTTKKQRE